nr:hypothetical protein Iba_chr07aCG15790 [Ipomoea batatas]
MNLSNALTDEEESKVFSQAVEANNDWCKNVGASMHKCAPEIAKIIKQDGRTITNELPTKQCCSELLRLGDSCYYFWMNYEASYVPQQRDLFAYSVEFLVNVDNVWTGCQSKVL